MAGMWLRGGNSASGFELRAIRAAAACEHKKRSAPWRTLADDRGASATALGSGDAKALLGYLELRAAVTVSRVTIERRCSPRKRFGKGMLSASTSSLGPF